MSTTETPVLSASVAGAREAIMLKLNEDPLRKWDARELMDEACGNIGGTVASIALWNLASEGSLVMTDDDQVSLPSTI